MARGRYQKGSLSLRKNVWIGRWREDVIMPDGRLHRIRKSVRIGTRAQFPTKRLAQRQFDLALVRVNAPTYQARRLLSFEAFVERWKAEILPLKKPSTQRISQSYLNRYLLPEFGSVTLDEIGPERVQALIARLGQKIGRQSVLNVVGTLSSILSSAYDWGYVHHKLKWDKLTLPRRLESPKRRFFSPVEARAIIDLAEAKYPGEPWAVFFRLAIMTGMRAGELLALKATDIDLERKLLLVQRSVWLGHVSATKSLASERVLPIPDDLARMLQRYILSMKPNVQQYLFATKRGKPVAITFVVQKRLRPILDELGMPRCGLHAFRHAHASMLVELGAPLTVARDQLGHSDVRLTLAVYSHAIGSSRRESIERLAKQLDSVGPTERSKDK